MKGCSFLEEVNTYYTAHPEQPYLPEAHVIVDAN